MAKKVAVVTGSNKGIGFAIVRGLCKAFEGDVYLTSRNEDLGKAAVAELGKEGLSPKYHQLDITDVASIDRLKNYLLQNYGGLDLLVNNAAIAYKAASTAPFSEQAEVSMRTNFTGTLNVCKALFPILRGGARVVNVSSMGGKMAYNKCSKPLQQKLKSLNTISEIEEYMAKFVEATKAGHYEKDGWPNTAYGTTKLGVTLMTYIQQRELDSDPARPDMVINSCCPGYVDTDMSSHKGTKTVDEGADTPLFLALLPPNTSSPRGEYLSERKIQHL